MNGRYLYPNGKYSVFPATGRIVGVSAADGAAALCPVHGDDLGLDKTKHGTRNLPNPALMTNSSNGRGGGGGGTRLW